MNNDTSDVPLKRCTKCGEEKPLEMFSRHKQGKDGLRAQCKACERVYQRDRQQSHPEAYAAKKSRDAERLKQRYHEDPEYRAEQQAKARGRSAVYYQGNKPEILGRERVRRNTDEYRAKRQDRLRQQVQDPQFRKDKSKWHAAYYQRNRTKILNRVAEYNKHHPEVLKASRLRRKARKRSLPDTFMSHHWLVCLDYWRGRCAACGSQLRDLFGNIEPHADHWIPLHNPKCPGTTPDNMICLCNRCNQSKSDKNPEQWLQGTFGERRATKILARVNAYFKWIVLL